MKGLLQDKDLVEDKLDCEGIFKQSSLIKGHPLNQDSDLINLRNNPFVNMGFKDRTSELAKF